MYSAENYMWGWVAYSAGSLCLLFCLWLLVRKISVKAIRHLTLLLAAVVLFTPVTAYRDDPHLAPAFFVSLYEGLLASGDDLSFQRGLAPILAIGFFAIIFYGLLGLLLSRLGKKRLPAAASSDQIGEELNVAVEAELKAAVKKVAKTTATAAHKKPKSAAKTAGPKTAGPKTATLKKAPNKR